MQVHITDLLKTRSVLFHSDMVRFVPSLPELDNCVNVDIVSVRSVVVTPETITFIFEDNKTFVANVPSDCYYKIEVL